MRYEREGEKCLQDDEIKISHRGVAGYVYIDARCVMAIVAASALRRDREFQVVKSSAGSTKQAVTCFFCDIFAEKCLGDRKISAERRNYEHCEGNHRPLHFP